MSFVFQEEIKEMEAKIQNAENFAHNIRLFERNKLWEKNKTFFAKYFMEGLEEKDESESSEARNKASNKQE